MLRSRSRHGDDSPADRPVASGDRHAPRAPGGWHLHAPQRRARPPLRADLEADVAIVGGGFSGLWTAYHLLKADPALRICLLEREVVGFGASGRNGGWLMGAAPADLRVWEKHFGLAAVRRAQQVLIDAVGEVDAVTRAEGIDAGLRLGGSLSIARSPAEVGRLRAHRDALVRSGWPAAGLSWIDPDEVLARVGAHATRGALVTEPCGTLDPVALVRGLASTIERLGATIAERSAVTSIEPGIVRTDSATVRAGRVVVATEAFTVEQPGQGRRYLPLASTMISTAPLPGPVRREIGWAGGEAVGDAHHLFFYAQHTRDGRIAIGGRGAPYKLGSALATDGHADPDTRARLIETLHQVWPQTAGVPIEAAWSGSLAVPRDWCASCGIDEATGTAWIGGFAGHGVAATFVLARSLASQLRGVPDPAGSQPWTMHRARSWEPEPLRWLASQAIIRVLGSSDRIEAAGGRARRARIVHRFTGS